MPENRAHADTGGRIAAGSERNRRAVEWNRNRKTVNSFTERSTVKRLLIVACLSLLWMTVVFGRLGYLQLFLHTEYMARAQRQQQRVIEITPKRGAIYDRNMHPLAMSIPVDSAFAVPSELGDQQLAARLISGVLGIPREVLEARFESSHSFVWIARKLPPDKKEAVEALNLKGVYFQKENQRIYPKRGLASHVLGFVDLDEKGLGGIEYELDGQIRGKSERIIAMADARRRWCDCEDGGGYVARHRIRGHKPVARLSVADILAQWSDVGASKTALRLGAAKFCGDIRAFGFGQATGVEMPGERRGLLRRRD